MNILVTGATGFIGSHLVPRLLDAGHSVSVLCRDIIASRKLFNDKVTYIQGNVSDPETLNDCCRDIDIVYHMAAIMGHDTPGDTAFLKFRAVNTEGTKNMVRQATLSGVKRFIYISSTAAMGLIKAPVVDETTKCEPWSPYQVSKRESELYLLNEAKSKKIQIIIIRPSMIFGPGFKGDFLTMARVVKKGFFPKIGFGKNLSPALFIDDLIAPLIAAGTKETLSHNLYIIASEESYPLDRIIRIIAKCIDKKVRFIYIPKWCALFGTAVLEALYKIAGKKPPVTYRNIKSTITDRTFSINRAINDLDFKQSVTIDSGLEKTIKYFREKKLI